MIGWIHLCCVFSLNYLYIADIFHDFVSKFSHLFFDRFRANQFFDQGSLDILSLSNVKLSDHGRGSYMANTQTHKQTNKKTNRRANEQTKQAKEQILK